ncbi:MAG: YdcF family protein [Nevskia sp.]|nr:YdcF family protein [Nevskia sp.]
MMLDHVATFLLVPPINLLLLALAGFALQRYRVGRFLCGLGLIGLLVLSMPMANQLLFLGLEEVAPPPAGAPAPVAIVILSADANKISDAPNALGVGFLSLERIRAGATLQRATGLPVLVSGGMIGHSQVSLAALLARSLETDFSVPVRWQESTSRTTWENAANSAAILHAEGIRSVFLVTHAWHMRRALIAFRHFGIAATPAPVPFSRIIHFRRGEFVPTVGAWEDSYYAMHEWIGCAWYELRALL